MILNHLKTSYSKHQKLALSPVYGLFCTLQCGFKGCLLVTLELLRGALWQLETEGDSVLLHSWFIIWKFIKGTYQTGPIVSLHRQFWRRGFEPHRIEKVCPLRVKCLGLNRGGSSHHALEKSKSFKNYPILGFPLKFLDIFLAVTR